MEKTAWNPEFGPSLICPSPGEREDLVPREKLEDKHHRGLIVSTPYSAGTRTTSL